MRTNRETTHVGRARRRAALAVLLGAALLSPLLAAANGGDPTAPPGAAYGPASDPRASLPTVYMVMHRGERRSAFVADDWRYEGEHAGAARIERIRADGVDVLFDDQRFYLPVVGHGVNKTRLLPKDFPGAKGP